MMKFRIAMALGSVVLVAAALFGAFVTGSIAPWHSRAEGTTSTTVVVTPPPRVPPPIDRRSPKTVVLDLETVEKRGVLANGVQYDFWTFNGTVPGPFIRVRVGDHVHVNVRNDAESAHLHSVNFHAVTGPGGGGDLQVAPGEQKAFEWTPLNPGLYVYHCMTPHVPVHIAQGMYGLVLVEPESGLPRVDREYYLMQGEFYTTGKTGAPGLQKFDSAKAHAEHPEYVVWNGHMGSLLGDNALQARVGETVRLYVGNGGPSLISSFHAVGAVFDAVWEQGGIGREPLRNVQMTMIPPGSAAIVEFRVPVPGRYFLVDHNYFRGHEKGTIAALDVVGPDARAIFHELAPAAVARSH